MTKIAVFEVEFETDLMVDEATLQEDFDGDWEKLMAYLFGEEGIGIFTEDLVLVNVKDKETEAQNEQRNQV